jgi:hypothetical protein
VQTASDFGDRRAVSQRTTRRATTGNVSGLLEALFDLRRIAPEHLKETPGCLRAAIEAVLEEFGEIPAARHPKKGATAKLSVGAALQAGLTPKCRQRGRHDAKRVPPGYEFRAGGLFRDTERIPETEPLHVASGTM